MLPALRTGVASSDDFGDAGLAEKESNYWGLLGDNSKVIIR